MGGRTSEEEEEEEGGLEGSVGVYKDKCIYNTDSVYIHLLREKRARDRHNKSAFKLNTQLKMTLETISPQNAIPFYYPINCWDHQNWV